MSGSTRFYLSCRVGREWYGIDADCIIKVLRLVALTELPDASPDVLGLMTLSDRVMPVIDLRRRFGLSDVSFQLETPIVAIDTTHGPVGLVVDDADDIKAIDESQVTLTDNSESPYIVGVARWSDHLLLLLDMSKLGAKTRTADGDIVSTPAQN
jgi:purine-binding chemotaxis protein CheW